MKIPTTTPVPAGPRPTDDANKPSARKSATSAESVSSHVEEPAEGAGAAGRDFASVLEETARPRERNATRDDADGEQFDMKTRERTEGEPETRRREGREGGEGSDAKGGGYDGRGGVREVLPAQGETAARAILHIADLERIVSTVRTQTLAGGVREVTVELRRSVLEGLKVKLSLDGAGRVSAEFIAASERVRAQLDARAGELAEILRSRGLNLSSLSTSVGADTSGRDAGGAQEFAALAAASDATTPRAAGVEAGEGDDTSSTAGDGTTYRA
jgi:hypothetical protein